MASSAALAAASGLAAAAAWSAAWAAWVTMTTMASHASWTPPAATATATVMVMAMAMASARARISCSPTPQSPVLYTVCRAVPAAGREPSIGLPPLPTPGTVLLLLSFIVLLLSSLPGPASLRPALPPFTWYRVPAPCQRPPCLPMGHDALGTALILVWQQRRMLESHPHPHLVAAPPHRGATRRVPAVCTVPPFPPHCHKYAIATVPLPLPALLLLVYVCVCVCARGWLWLAVCAAPAPLPPLRVRVCAAAGHHHRDGGPATPPPAVSFPPASWYVCSQDNTSVVRASVARCAAARPRPRRPCCAVVPPHGVCVCPETPESDC